MKHNRTKTFITSRQWALYNYLVTQSQKNPTKWVTPDEIFLNVDGYVWDSKAYDHCKGIRTDKKALNALEETDKIIVMKNRCFKIGTREEVLEERQKHYKRAMIQLIEVSNLNRKYKLDGQFKLLNNRGEEMTPNSKLYRETFNEDIEKSVETQD